MSRRLHGEELKIVLPAGTDQTVFVLNSSQFSNCDCVIVKHAEKEQHRFKNNVCLKKKKKSNLFIQGSDMNGDGVIGQFSKAVVQFEEVLFLSASLLRGSSREQAKGVTVSDTVQEMTLTIARLHALCVAVLLRVPGDGSHIGHVVTFGVGVGRVR